MDLRLKGKSWAGNIYHQFESICQDVDGFMSKDTMKYVENQVQSVGVSVKRFYNVVQDILPLPGDDVKPKALSLAGKQLDMKDHVNSITAIIEKPTCVDEKQLSVEQDSIDSVRSSNTSLLVELDHVMIFTKPPCVDHSQEAKSDLHLSEDGDAIISNDADNCIEENITRDSIPLTTDSSSENQIFSVKSDEDHKTSSPALSANEAGFLAINEEKTSRYCFSDDAECLSNTSSTGWLCSEKILMVDDPKFNEDRNLSVPSVSSSDKVQEDKSLLMDSPLSSAFGVAKRALGEDGVLSDSFSTKDDVSTSVQSPEHVFPYFSCDDDEEETDGITSSFSTFPKSCNIMESTSADFIQKAENICNSHTNANGCSFNISTSSSATISCQTKAIYIVPAFSILESNDNNASSIDGSVSVVGSSESNQEQHGKDALSNFSISPDTGKTHEFGDSIGDVNMEIVDLSTNVNHDGRSVIFNINFGHAARRRNFRYYKKLIQEAFASRKRLSKEYEHLAILYGDIDTESRQHFEPNSLPSSPTSIHAPRTRSFQETCETEWELL